MPPVPFFQSPNPPRPPSRPLASPPPASSPPPRRPATAASLAAPSPPRPPCPAPRAPPIAGLPAGPSPRPAAGPALAPLLFSGRPATSRAPPLRRTDRHRPRPSTDPNSRPLNLRVEERCCWLPPRRLRHLPPPNMCVPLPLPTPPPTPRILSNELSSKSMHSTSRPTLMEVWEVVGDHVLRLMVAWLRSHERCCMELFFNGYWRSTRTGCSQRLPKGMSKWAQEKFLLVLLRSVKLSLLLRIQMSSVNISPLAYRHLNDLLNGCSLIFKAMAHVHTRAETPSTSLGLLQRYFYFLALKRKQ